MTWRIPLVAFICAAVALPSSLAFADPLKKDSKDYAYEFPDDKMLGSDGAGVTPIIKVRKAGTREVLLRPRLHFVPELLKSVENM